ncbi:hypothetical protein RB195_008357 [Necator americanus]|uniref:Uncharacterized protein n=1 Tax=Necator americanus TaxID=51031 RepID=A0ABR1CPR7_NECAM
MTDQKEKKDSFQVKPSSFLCGFLRIIISSIILIAFAFLFVLTYVALSEYHGEQASRVHEILKISDRQITDDLLESVLWVLDGTVVCICLFLILEDAYLVYELNWKLQQLNSEAYLSLREAVRVDNRYIKDAIVLEAQEAQEINKAAHQTKERSLPTTPQMGVV